MKVQILQENLNAGLVHVARVIPSRPQVPILANILLTAREGVLQLTSSNAETTITTEVGAKVEEEGEITVPGRTFTEIIGSLSAGKIVIELSEGILSLKAGAFSGKINGVAASEYPKMTEIAGGGGTVEIDEGELLTGVARAVAATATDESRAVLTGVLFRTKDKELMLAATDGFRLSVVTLSGTKKGEVEPKEHFIIPAKSLAEMARVATELKSGKEKEKKIKLVFSPDGTQVVFDLGETKIYSRLITGNFPDFEKIIPSDYAVKIGVPGEDLTKAVKLAAVFARESANIVKLSVRGKQLTVTSQASQAGENTMVLDVQSEGKNEEELTIAFNYRYLMDFLNVANAPEMTLELNGPLAPGVFRVKGETNFLHIIMPVRVQN